MTQSPAGSYSQETMQPHLIHIGFPKCASTFLQQWFAAHPQIAYKPGGLAGRYSVFDLIQEVIEGTGEERCRVTSAEQLSVPRDPSNYGFVDATDNALQHERTAALCDRLARMYPDALILMVTRNHTDLLRSGYSQMIRQGSDLSAADLLAISAKLALEMNDFDLVLRTYRDLFGGRVLALPYELLVADRREFLAQIERFIGVDPFDIAAEKVNPSLSEEELYWYPRMGRFLRRFPQPWIARKLLGLHRRMIALGGWKPLLPVLRLLGQRPAKSVSEFDWAPAIDADKVCPELLREAIYAPYRELYRGVRGVA